MNTGIRSSSGVRLASLAAALVAALAQGVPSGTAAAQDVEYRARHNGVPLPTQMIERKRRDPGAYEFQRAWRNRTLRARQARIALQQREGARLSVAQIQAADAAVTGTLRVPVILALYNGTPAPYTQAQYQSRLFGSSTTAYSAKRFYQEMSRGAFALDGTVTPWVTLPQNKAYYEPSAATHPEDGRLKEFLRDALLAADPGTNFAQFDNDGPDGVPNSGDDDGYVDAAAFLYAADELSCGGSGIWPHRWTYSANWGAPYTTNDARAGGGFIRVDDYLIQGGISCDGASLMEIGTFAHEMGHALALPDLYDTSDFTEGVGEWDLMGAGSYNNLDSPAHMGAWSKDFLGWVNVDVVTSNRSNFILQAVYSGTVLRYNIPGTDEYFLLEHRDRIGSDAFLHAPGLLVTHIDESVVNAGLFTNRVNAGAIHGVDIEEADGDDDLDWGINRGDAGDVFPGSSGRTSFGATGYPNSSSNAEAASGFSLSNITLSNMVLSFNVGTPTTTPTATLVVPAGLQASAPAGQVDTVDLAVAMSDGSAKGFAVLEGATTSQDYPWLTIVADSGTTPATVKLVANAAGLSAGTYTGAVRVRSAGAANSPVAVPVTFTVTSAAAATVVVSQTNLTFSAPVGDSIVQQVVRVSMSDGSARTVNVLEGGTTAVDYPWLVVAPMSGTSPRDFFFTALTHGLYPGTYTAKVGVHVAGVSNSPVLVNVTLNVTGTGFPVLNVGDSVTTTFTKTAERDTVRFKVNASGTVVDLGVWSLTDDPDFLPTLYVTDLAGTVLANPSVRRVDGEIVAAFKTPSAGTFRMIVLDRNTAAATTRQYRVRTRLSAPVVGFGGVITDRSLRQGTAGTYVDSLRIRNYGQGTATWNVAVEGSWVSVAPVSGTLPAGAAAPPAVAAALMELQRAAVARGEALDDQTLERRVRTVRRARAALSAAPSEPARAAGPPTVITLTSTPGALQPGHHSAVLDWTITPGDAWNPPAVSYQDTRIYDTRVAVLDSTVSTDPGILTVGADGKVVLAVDGSLVKMDTTTGAITPWVNGAVAYASGMKTGPDGSVYVADWDGMKVVKITPQGVFSTIIQGNVPAIDVAVAPDGTVWAVVGRSLVRRAPDGTTTVPLTTTTRGAFSYGIAYLNGHVYYTADGHLRRYTPASGTDSQLGALPESANGELLNLAVGPDGKLYGTENSFAAGTLVLDEAGNVVKTLWSPGVGYGIAVAQNGTVYGTSQWPMSAVWKLPLGAPATGTALVGDPSGDGQITSMDALGVLSHVVGKTLPAGWSMAVSGDANCDGQVTSVDALIILSQVVQKNVSAFCIGTRR